MTIDETCSCGARFVVTDMGSIPNATFNAAAEWRDNHKHAESVGICGDRPALLGLTHAPYCELKAGHAGMHSDGDGHWTPHRPEP